MAENLKVIRKPSTRPSRAKPGAVIGAPSLYPHDPIEFRDKALKALELFAQGASKHAVAIKVYDIDHETLYQWEADKTKPLFASLIKKGVALSLTYWEELLHECMRNKNLNAIPLIFQMKCRHPALYRDNPDLTVSGSIEVKWAEPKVKDKDKDKNKV